MILIGVNDNFFSLYLWNSATSSNRRPKNNKQMKLKTKIDFILNFLNQIIIIEKVWELK
jgi:hypothetical protein